MLGSVTTQPPAFVNLTVALRSFCTSVQVAPACVAIVR
jgi:hypothetical protein